MKEKIQKILQYLADEDQHFWENCQCSEEIQEAEDFNKCKCDENKNHIFRTVKEVSDWLDSPSCPLVCRNEL